MQHGIEYRQSTRRQTVRFLSCFVPTLIFLLITIPFAIAEDNETADSQATKAEALAIEMKTKLHTHEAYPGDEIVLEVSFIADKPFAANPLGSLPLEGFDLKDRKVNRSEKDGKHIVEHRFILLRFEPGEYELPRIPFSLRLGDGNEERKSDLLRVTVKSLLQEEGRKIALQQMRDRQAKDKDAKNGQAQPKMVMSGQNQPIGPTFNLPQGSGSQLPPQAQSPGQQAGGTQTPEQVQLAPRDIKKPVPLIRKDYILLYLAGGILALLLLGLIVWLGLRRINSREVVIEKVVDTRPAHQIALEKLRDLEAEQLVAKRKLKLYHVKLAEILHEYFGKRYNLIDALSMTSDELISRLDSLYLRDLDGRIVADLLYGCDMTKFAKFKPDDKTCIERIGQARMIVDRTKEENLGVS